MQTLIKNVGGTIETYFTDHQVSSCTVSLYTGEGAIKVDTATATVDAVATTLSGAAAAEDTTVALASASSVAVGRRYLIGAINSTEVSEVVMVKSLASSTATLWGPLLFSHSSGAAFKGTRVSYSVASTSVDVLSWGGYADFVPNTGDVQTETVDIVLRKISENIIDTTDLALIFPKLYKMLDAELDMPTALREARDNFLQDLGGRFRVHCMLGTEHFRRPCSLKFFLNRRHAFGSDWKEVMDGMERDYDGEITKLRAQIPTDNDQDGMTTGANDGAYTVIQMERA